MGVQATAPSSEEIGIVSQPKVKPPDSGGDEGFTPCIFNANAFLDSSKPAWDTSEWLQPKLGHDQKNASDILPAQSAHLPSRPENDLPMFPPQYSPNHTLNEKEPTYNGDSPSDLIQTSQNAELHAAVANRENPRTTESAHQALYNGRSSSESLRILADQMTELCSSETSPEISQPAAQIAVLESRIQDLNAQLAAERSNNQQLQIHMKESVSIS